MNGSFINDIGINNNKGIGAHSAAVPVVAVGTDGEIFFDKSDEKHRYRIKLDTGKYLDRSVSSVFDALVCKLGDNGKIDYKTLEGNKGNNVSKPLYYAFSGNEKICYEIPDGPVNEFIAKIKNGYSIESGKAGEIFLRRDGCYCFDHGAGRDSSQNVLVVALDDNGKISNEIFKDGMVKKYLYYTLDGSKKLFRIPDEAVIEFSKSVREFRKGVADKFEIRQGKTGKIFLASDGYYRFNELLLSATSKSLFVGTLDNDGNFSYEIVENGEAKKDLFYRCGCSTVLYRIPKEVVSEFSKDENKLEIKPLSEGSLELDTSDLFSLDCNGKVSSEIYEIGSKFKEHLFYRKIEGEREIFYRIPMSRLEVEAECSKDNVSQVNMFNNMNNMNMNNSINMINNNMINMNQNVGLLNMFNNMNSGINVINDNTMVTSNHISKIRERIPRMGGQNRYYNDFQK